MLGPRDPTIKFHKSRPGHLRGDRGYIQYVYGQYSYHCYASIFINLLFCCCLQLGTLGAGNHYAEIQIVDEIYDKQAAARMGVERNGQVR